jgi:hypothetical protein
MPMMPKYFGRSRMENRSPMQTYTRMMSPPPPIPWTTRAPMSIPIDEEIPASNDPTRKTTFAMRMIYFRPKISEILPHTGADAAAASKYAEPIDPVSLNMYRKDPEAGDCHLPRFRLICIRTDPCVVRA